MAALAYVKAKQGWFAKKSEANQKVVWDTWHELDNAATAYLTRETA